MAYRPGLIVRFLLCCVGGNESSRNICLAGALNESSPDPSKIASAGNSKSISIEEEWRRMRHAFLEERRKVVGLEARLEECLKASSEAKASAALRSAKPLVPKAEVVRIPVASKLFKTESGRLSSESVPSDGAAAAASLTHAKGTSKGKNGCSSPNGCSSSADAPAAEGKGPSESKPPSPETRTDVSRLIIDGEPRSTPEEVVLAARSQVTMVNGPCKGKGKGKGKGCPPPLPKSKPKAENEPDKAPPQQRMPEDATEALAGGGTTKGKGKGKGGPPPPTGKAHGKGKAPCAAGAKPKPKAQTQAEIFFKSSLALANDAGLNLSTPTNAKSVLDLLELDRAEYYASFQAVIQESTEGTPQNRRSRGTSDGTPLKMLTLPNYTTPVLKRLNVIQLGVSMKSIGKAIRMTHMTSFDDVFDCVAAEEMACVGEVAGPNSKPSEVLVQLRNVLKVVGDADLEDIRADPELQLAKTEPEKYSMRFGGVEETTLFLWTLASRLPDTKVRFEEKLSCLAKLFDVNEWLHYARKIANDVKAYYLSGSAKRLLFSLDASLMSEILVIGDRENSDAFNALPNSVRSEFKAMDRMLKDSASVSGYKQGDNVEANWVNVSAQDAFVPFLYTANVLARRGNSRHFASKYVNLLPRLAPSHLDVLLIFAANNGFSPGMNYINEFQELCGDLLGFEAPSQPSEGISGMLRNLYDLHKDPVGRCISSQGRSKVEWEKIRDSTSELIDEFEKLFETVMSTVGPVTRSLVAHMAFDAGESSGLHARLRDAAVALPQKMQGAAWENPLEPTVDWPFASLWDDFCIRVNLQKFCKRVQTHHKRVIRPGYFRVRGDIPGVDVNFEKARNPTIQ